MQVYELQAPQQAWPISGKRRISQAVPVSFSGPTQKTRSCVSSAKPDMETAASSLSDYKRHSPSRYLGVARLHTDMHTAAFTSQQ